MKKEKQKAQQKANRKKAEKAVKAALINELTTLISSFAIPNKKLKKLIDKAATAFSKEIDKTAKPIIEVEQIKEEATAITKEKKITKPRAVKKVDKEATK
ncbi:hypothetical protein [Pedobacter sp. SL55]|uniref:hypothetical protein n=1 Tax=Pedobacter sp. SL55 TaxID=2995161 RepID=UPI00226DD8C8|nr:hypothetical protein [Pedobacter sp. SL55]WAC40286.1 hypothetical protein OVA16_17190 [Pedobacter sp. SL55]